MTTGATGSITRELPKRQWLQFYAQSFSTVELNNSFYQLPAENSFAIWRDSSPEDFVFEVKVSRLITHLKKLKGIAGPLQMSASWAKCHDSHPSYLRHTATVRTGNVVV